MRTPMIIATMFTLVCVIATDQTFAQSSRHFSGLASFYDKNFKGRTARGEPYDADKLTAAHRTLPFGTRLRVTDKRTRRSVIVVVNDRGPFIKGRVLDLSYAAAKALNVSNGGLIKITASLE